MLTICIFYLQDTSVLVMGSSHVRRLMSFEYLLPRHLQGIKVEWRHRGGAGIHYIETNIHQVAGIKMVVLVVGGNDISNGISPHQLADRICFVAFKMVREYGVETVAITSLWPRACRVYNNRARRYAEIMEQRLFGDPQVTFWLWDRRQPWRSCDGTHLSRHGYRRAMTYLVAVVVWLVNNNLWW